MVKHMRNNAYNTTKQQYKSKNGECEKDINECVRKSRKCVNYDDSEKMTKCYRDAINWADKHCNSHPNNRHPHHIQRPLCGETYAQECIQQAKSSGRNYSEQDIMKCLSHKFFNLDYDSDAIQKCGEDGINFIQNNYEDSHPDHRQPGHTQVRAERYGKECIQQAKSSGLNSQEHVIKCVTHKCFNLDYDSDTIQKCSLYGVKYVQDNYDNSDFYGVY